MAILETKDLRKIYGSGENEVHALDGVSISVDEGEFAAVVGTSGSGKSTLLNMLGGLDRPTSGSVIIQGKELLKMKDEELTIFRRRNIGFVFQNYNLLPVLNVYENIVYPIEIDGVKADTKFVRQIIHTLGLEKKLKNMPNNLSGGKLSVMAFHNVFRDRKRAILVFMSLFMGITVILGVNGVVGSISGENYVKAYADYDFQYIDTQFTQYEHDKQEIPQFDEHLVEQITQIDGIQNITVQKAVWSEISFDEDTLNDFMRIAYEDSSYLSQGESYEEMVNQLKSYAETGNYGCFVVTLDESIVEQYNETHDRPIDLEAFRRGDLAIAGNDTGHNAPNAALAGKTLTLTADSADGKSADFLIGGAFTFEDYDPRAGVGSRKHIEIVPQVIYVSEAGMEKLTQTAIIYNIGIDAADYNQLQEIDKQLQDINRTLTASDWVYNSSVSMLEEFNQMFYSINLLGNGAAILLIFLGLINFVNVMLTGVIARKNEFAVMESIGTTKRQIRKILTLEGGIYALISTLLIMTFGNAFLLLVANAVPSIANYAKFEYPVLLVVCLIAAIFAICLMWYKKS